MNCKRHQAFFKCTIMDYPLGGASETFTKNSSASFIFVVAGGVASSGWNVYALLRLGCTHLIVF